MFPVKETRRGVSFNIHLFRKNQKTLAHILHLDSSPRGADSHSRQSSGKFVQSWLQAHPGDAVTRRDIGHQTIPHVTEEFIGAMYTPAETRTPAQVEALKLSDELIGELRAADVYVFGIPMYNFSVPAVFKAYIDQVIRAGETFNPANYAGLLTGKSLFVVTARGGSGYGPGEAREAYNVQDPTIRTAFGLAGVTDQTFIHVNGTSSGTETDALLTPAREQIKALTAA